MGGGYIRDLSLRQFMYGKRAGDDADKPILVDLEHHMLSNFNPTSPDFGTILLARDIVRLYHEVEKMESTYGQKYTAVKETIAGLMSSVTASSTVGPPGVPGVNDHAGTGNGVGIDQSAPSSES